MAGTIYSGTYTTGITLSNPATQNPATVTATGVIDVNSSSAYYAALTGAVGTAWTLANLGTIESVGVKGVGIRLQSGGSVVNGHSGATTGLIEGSFGGIQINGAAGTVSNYGTIDGSVQLSAGGIVSNLGTIDGGVFLVDAGGSVTNGSSGSTAGLIVGNQSGVGIDHGTATVTNFGSIKAIGSVAATSFSAGIFLFDGGGIDNFGTIRDVGTTGSGINLQAGGSVTNGSSSATGADYWIRDRHIRQRRTSRLDNKLRHDRGHRHDRARRQFGRGRYCC